MGLQTRKDRHLRPQLHPGQRGELRAGSFSPGCPAVRPRMCTGRGHGWAHSPEQMPSMHLPRVLDPSCTTTMPPAHIPPWPGLPHRWGLGTGDGQGSAKKGPEMGRSQRTPPKCSVEPSAHHLCTLCCSHADLPHSRLQAFFQAARVQNLS